ncbi:hypothetical protein BZG02_04545 [Labilibaculum filiforme]|uniref:Ig-like domain-containing protein n=1 Tax=Labilibaculum filiforme TaxID=1940526 RepID=A0A2N3I474_9BACT|nr:gliding motility-associated C-terminal domain-containing protein [Labilibaculum filiforme]PKQ65104.1 hypothetical protein BZG02_04545 [Labilibaculum filiforme]
MRNGKISTQLVKMFKLTLIGLLFVLPFSGMAQYDYEHYVPPFYCSAQVGKQEVFLSTNSEKDLKIFIEDGQGKTVAGPFTISRNVSKTYIFTTPGGDTYGSHNSSTYPDGCSYSYGIIGPKDLNKPIDGQGLRIYSYDGPFFANIRHGFSNGGESGALTHGGSLSAKGAYAKGQDFYSGHLYSHTINNSDPSYSGGYPIRSHFISVMAVEDGQTEVSFSGIKCKYITKYEGGKVVLQSIDPSEKITRTLSKGQSYVIGVNLHANKFNSESSMVRNGLNGTHITSKQKIVVNCGSWTAGAKPSQDIGFDQIVPVDQVRDKYIVMKGEGKAEPNSNAYHAGQERTIVVATQDNTQVWANGSNKGTLAKAGDFIILDDIVNPTAIPTLYIDTKGKDVYVYQTMCGTNNDWTNIGLNFIPPLTGLGIKEVVIPNADHITTGDGGLINPTVTVLAQKNVDVQRNGVSLSNPQDVTGTTEWVYYKVPSISGDCRFTGSKAINVAWTASSNTLGAAGYYSGFTKAVSPIHPVLNIDTELSLVCESYDENIGVSLVEPLPDFYEWYVNDSTEPFIENGPLVVPAPDVETLYHVIGYYRDPSLDLLFNGDFSDGFNGFESDYGMPVTGNLVDPGYFALASSPVTENPALADYSAMDGGRMFLGYSDRQGEVVYQVNELPVEENFSYIFKMYGRLAQKNASSSQSLKVLINDEVIIENFKIDKFTEWQSFSALWKPGTERKATIKILNQNLDANDTFFALDSISFVQAVQDTETFTARVIPNFSTVKDGEVHFCKGVANSLDVSNGDTSWYNYSWSKDGVDLVNGTLFDGVKSHELTFKNPQDAQEGIYICTIGFKPEYKDCATSDATVDVSLTVFVDEAATVRIETDKVNFCSGASTTLNAIVTGDAGEVKWYINGDTSPISVGKSFLFNYPTGTYTVRCEAGNGCGVAFDEVVINVLSTPELVSLTSNDNLCVGKNIIITAQATGDGTLVYTWQRDSDLLSETGNVLNYTASILDRESTFKVKVKSVYTIASETIECVNGSGKAVFDLNIIPLVEFDKLLADATVCAGKNHSFSVTMKYPGDFYTYSWTKEGAPITNNLSSYNLSDVKVTDAGNYRVDVTNQCNSEFSAADLMVTPKIEVKGFSLDKYGPFCNATAVTATFNVVNNGAVYVYQVIEPGGTIKTITNPYTFTVDAGNQGDFEFLVSSSCDTPVSFKPTLKMYSDFGTLSVEDVGTCIGENVTFEADISSIPTGSVLTYAWTDNLGNPIGTNSDKLEILNVQDSNLGTYTVVVTDQCGNSKTDNANLTKEAVTSPTTAAAVTICEGDNFSTTISYLGNPTFEWRFNDATSGPIVGTTETLSLTNVSLAQAGTYYCTVELICGTDVVIRRELKVNAHVALFDATDKIVDLCVGEKPLLSLLNSEINGKPTDYSIVWKDAGGVIIGSGNSIQLDAHTSSGSYLYSATVVGKCESPIKTYRVIVHEKPTITPVDPVVACEGDIVLSIGIVGSDYNGVEWWNADETVKYGNGINYTITGATDPTSEGTYVAKVTTDYCDAVTTNVLVTIYEPIKITSTSNLNPTPCAGSPLSLVVNATGDGVAYKWYVTGTPGVIIGTSKTLSLGVADASDNKSYTCEVYSLNGCDGDTRIFNVNVKEHVAITSQPADVEICASVAPATFTVAATGDGVLVYTWYDKDDNVVGGNSSTLSIADPLANNGQNYYCIVSGDNCNDMQSDKASLIVKEEVLITDHPDDVKIADGGDASFSVVASGDPTLTYQWQESVDGTGPWTNISNGGVYSGAASATLIMTGIDKGTYDTNKYRCVVDNACTPKISNPALLEIDANVKILVQPKGFNACVGAVGGSFTVSATASSVYNWVYRESSSDAFVDVTTGGMTNGNPTLNLPTITEPMKNWEFRCIVSFGVTTPDVSNTVKVNVFVPVTFDEIADVTLCSGTGTHFKIQNLAGTGPYSYSWDRGATNLGTNSQLTLTAANATDANYKVSVGNGVCPVKTDEFAIDHYTDLALNAWTNGNETCVGEIPKEELTVTTSNIDGHWTPGYSWTKDGDPTVLGTSATYTIPGLSSTETGLYKVEVSDGCSSQSISGFVNVYDPIVKINSWKPSEAYCLGTDLTLNAKVSGDNPTYVWTYPDATRTPVGNKASLKFNALTAADAGTYTCTVSSSCDAVVVYTIVISVIGAPEITTGIEVIPAVCEGDALELGPIVVSGTYNDPVWTLNDHITQVTTTVNSLDLGTAELTEAGNYLVTVSNKCGSDASLGELVVNPTLMLDPIASQTVCAGNDVVFKAVATGAGLNYQWLVDGVDQGVNSSELIIDAAAVLAFDLNTSQTYNVVCNITSTTGCGVASEATTLLVNPNTVLHATLKNVVKYVGDNHTMTVDVSGVDLVFSWTHELADGTKVPLAETGPTINLTNIAMADAGYYTCKIIGTCGQRLASGKLTVKEPVSITSGLVALEEKCVGDPLSLSITASGQITSIKWFKNDVEIVGETSLNYFISAVDLTDAAIYKCEIEGEGVTVISETTTVRVYSQTALVTPIEDRILCEGVDLDWSAGIDGTAVMTYQWTLNGVDVSDQKILHYDALALSNEGNYEVQVTSLCGDVSTKAKLEVIELPAFVSISNDTVVCENTPLVEFNVEYKGEQLKYQWRKDGIDLAGKTSETLSLTNIQLTDIGSYNCRVYSGCGDELSPEITLDVTPQLQVLSDMVDMEVCMGEDVLFTADAIGNNVSYQWKVDGVDVVDVPGVITGANTNSLSIDSAQVAHSGYYTCILSDECTDYRSTKPTRLIVNALPNTAIYGRMVLCAKEDRVTYVLNQVDADVYNWNVNGGIFAGPEEGAKTRVTWKEDPLGSLSVEITDLATGCKSRVDSAVILNQLPIVNLTSLDSKGVCEGEFELTGGNHTGGIYWVNGISETVFNPSERGAGTYAVHYSYTDEYGCSNVTPITDLTVDVLPVVDVTDDITVGSCNPTPLTAKTDEDNIQWFKIQDNNRVLPDNLDNRNSMNPIFTPGKSQVLLAMVKDEHGCEGIDLLNLSVAPLPVVTTINDTTVGQCNQLVLQTDIVGDKDVISWTNPDHLDHSDISSPQIIDAPEGTHTYAISVTDLYGCDAAGEVTVTIVADPTVGEDRFGCYGDKFEVDLTGLENPVWNDNDDTFPIRTIENPGEYLLTVSNDYKCGDEQLFVINPKMNLGLKDNLFYEGQKLVVDSVAKIVDGKTIYVKIPVIIFEGQTLTLATNLPSYYEPYFYEWQDGSIFRSFEVSETGTYTLKVEDNLGCVAIDSVDIEVKPVGIESSNAFLPLANDNINDVFYLGDGNLNMGSEADARFSIIEKFEMYVYDRWGELLYKTNEQGYKGGWDGTYKGKLCPAGAYVWIVFINGELTNKGTFMLIR